MTHRKKYPKKQPTAQELNEPNMGYSLSPTVRIFHSFEEMNDADAKEMASFTPLERLTHITEMIKTMYAEELKNKMTNLTIHLKSHGDTIT